MSTSVWFDAFVAFLTGVIGIGMSYRFTTYRPFRWFAAASGLICAACGLLALTALFRKDFGYTYWVMLILYLVVFANKKVHLRSSP